MLDALFRQWKRVPPLPVAIQRVSRHFGVREPKQSRARKPQPMTAESFERLRSVFPVSNAPIIVPMSPEDFRRISGGE